MWVLLLRLYLGSIWTVSITLTVQKWYKLLSRDPDCLVPDNSYHVNNTAPDINEEKLVLPRLENLTPSKKFWEL